MIKKKDLRGWRFIGQMKCLKSLKSLATAPIAALMNIARRKLIKFFQRLSEKPKKQNQSLVLIKIKNLNYKNMATKTFRQIQNDEKAIIALADGYKSVVDHPLLWLVDGLQKDAIQNSWDARIDKKHAKDWECGFVFKNINGKKFFYVVDSGTTGLRGTKFNNEEDRTRILTSNERGEDLSYFLNSNWSAKSIKEGGSRGRGKTLFLFASKKYRVFFDSFRATDNAYVAGEIFLDVDKGVKFKLYYDEEGKDKIKEWTDKEINLLTNYGTRIFIVDPKPEIEKSIESGEIISFISHSSCDFRKNNRARNNPPFPQRCDRQIIRRRCFAKKKTSGKAEKGEEKNEIVRES